MKAAGQKDFAPMGNPPAAGNLDGHKDQSLEAVHGNAKAPGQSGAPTPPVVPFIRG